jgi:hypothetical protein
VKWYGRGHAAIRRPSQQRAPPRVRSSLKSLAVSAPLAPSASTYHRAFVLGRARASAPYGARFDWAIPLTQKLAYYMLS